VIRVLRGEVEAVEREWAEQLGAGRYAQLRDTLHELARRLGKLEGTGR